MATINRNVAGTESGSDTFVRLEQVFREAERAWLAALDAEELALETASMLCGPRPEMPEEPEGYDEAFAELTIGELRDSKSLAEHSVPVIAEHTAALKKYHAEQKEWNKRREDAENAPAVRRAKAKQKRTYKAVDAAYRAIMAEPAITLGDMLHKARIAEYWDSELNCYTYDQEANAFYAIAADIERMASRVAA